MKDHREIKKFTKERMGEIAFRIMLELGLRIPPAEIVREIGNLSKKSKVPEKDLKNFAKDLVSAEWDTIPVFILTDREQRDIALKLLICKYNSNAEKLRPEEAKRARALMATRIRVSAEAFEQFSAEIMKSLYEEALRQSENKN